MNNQGSARERGQPEDGGFDEVKEKMTERKARTRHVRQLEVSNKTRARSSVCKLGMTRRLSLDWSQFALGGGLEEQQECWAAGPRIALGS